MKTFPFFTIVAIVTLVISNYLSPSATPYVGAGLTIFFIGYIMSQSRSTSPVEEQPDLIPSWLPKQIGRLHLGDQLSSNDHYCGGSHEIADGEPIYWQDRIGEYPDDIDGYCLKCAIDCAESYADY